MADILVYALHYEGAFNKNSLGAVSEAARLAGELGGEAHAVVVGEGIPTSSRPRSAATARRRSSAPRRPEGLAQPVIDVDGPGHERQRPRLRAVRRRPARLRDRRRPGRAPGRRRDDGGHGGQRRRTASSPPSARSWATRRSPRRATRTRASSSAASTRSRPARAGGGDAAVEDVQVELSPWSTQATMVQRGEQRGADVNIEDADILVAGGRGLGKAEGFELAEDLAERARRRRRRHPRGGRRRLVPLRRPDRPDGQDRRAEALPRRRHLRRDPAQGRHAGLGEHRGDQQGRQRPDLRVLRPRASSATSTRSSPSSPRR